MARLAGALESLYSRVTPPEASGEYSPGEIEMSSAPPRQHTTTPTPPLPDGATRALAAIMKAVEAKISTVTTKTPSPPPRTTGGTPDSGVSGPGCPRPIPTSAAVCKAVRLPKTKMAAAGAMVKGAIPDPMFQPHVKVVVTPKVKGKWETPDSGKASAGSIMIDTGASCTVVSSAWAKAHGLKVQPLTGNDGASRALWGLGGKKIPAEGTTAMTLQLSPTLEIDLEKVTVHAGTDYQALLGTDLLGGVPRVLGPAKIKYPGEAPGYLQIPQPIQGCVAHIPLLPTTPPTTPPDQLTIGAPIPATTLEA